MVFFTTGLVKVVELTDETLTGPAKLTLKQQVNYKWLILLMSDPK